MSGRQELIDNDPEQSFRKRELFEQRYVTTKYGVLNRVDQAIKMFEGQVNRLSKDDSDIAYVKMKIQYLQRFSEKIKGTVLPDPLADWWSYSFSLGAQGAVLYLNHYDGADIEGEEGSESLHMWDHDAEFPLVAVRSELLSAEEFAALHNVAGPTIRVWIRRGKIRSAVKVGNTWKIPELASPITRKYEKASYKWDVPLENLPDYFSGLEEPAIIDITQSHEKKQMYEVIHCIGGDNPRVGNFIITGPQAEKLEAFLIAHPSVSYIGDTEYFD